MQIVLDDVEYKFDLSEITVMQMKVLKKAFGLNLMTLEQGLAEFDADALLAVYWLMLEQSGKSAPLEMIDFKVVTFARAIQAAVEKEAEDKAAEAKAEKAKAKAPRNPTSTPRSSSS
jgi:hypothetical protein